MRAVCPGFWRGALRRVKGARGWAPVRDLRRVLVGGIFGGKKSIPMNLQDKRVLVGLAGATLLGLSGCASQPPADRATETKSGYVPFAERPPGAATYWAMRDLEDRIDSERERQASAPR